MLEPDDNPNPPHLVDPPLVVRRVMSRKMSQMADRARIAKARKTFETNRKATGAPHQVEYFHQLDDPYSHLTAQVLERFARRYDVELVPHLVRGGGGAHQPELEKLAVWARRDCGLIAPHYGLSFPQNAGVVPDAESVMGAAQFLAGLGADEFVSTLEPISTALWSRQAIGHVTNKPVGADEAEKALDDGSAHQDALGHYSGGSFYYGGEWYWGVDRLFHLEERLRGLGLAKEPGAPFLVERPGHDVADVDASGLTLEFYPSLNSPYTAIIFDRTVEMARSCGVELKHKPVLPMIMRGVAASNFKGRYILFDTKREADYFDVPFGPVVTPLGEPTRRSYSLMPFAAQQGKDVDFLSILLRLAFTQGIGLHKDKNIRRAAKEAGLDWAEAKKHLGSDAWKAVVERNQDEMVDGMGLWGVPSFRLSGPGRDGASEPDLEVWGQDRLWLVAAEIRRRAGA